MRNAPIIIIGHKGKTGARVQQRLEAMNIQTRGLSCTSSPAFDWEKSETWAKSLEGAKAAYVTYQPDLAVPRAESDIKKLVKEAKRSGLEHLVLLSGRGEEGAQKAEKVLQNSGLAWNVVRASWFMQNFSESFMLEGIMTGTLALPADSVLEPFVDLDDIADVATVLLTESKFHNQVIEVTGPEAITFAQCVSVIAETIRRPIKYQAISIDDFMSELQKVGVPKDIQWLMRELFTVVLDGRNTAVTDDITNVLGRPATTFQDYVTNAVKTGVWDSISDEQKVG